MTFLEHKRFKRLTLNSQSLLGPNSLNGSAEDLFRTIRKFRESRAKVKRFSIPGTDVVENYLSFVDSFPFVNGLLKCRFIKTSSPVPYLLF